MEQYTKSYLKSLVRSGIAKDITDAPYTPTFNEFEKIGYCSGIYGISGGLLKDRETGQLYVILARNSNLTRIF